MYGNGYSRMKAIANPSILLMVIIPGKLLSLVNAKSVVHKHICQFVYSNQKLQSIPTINRKLQIIGCNNVHQK